MFWDLIWDPDLENCHILRLLFEMLAILDMFSLFCCIPKP